ncbi:MAG TPA: cytochrome c biogenesis protein CcdA [Candidatus Bathyarchaeia archaeon]|nr:cytochrome c biogenesis protein CcdA [Candidatus Bathyarchaeia archaeon]
MKLKIFTVLLVVVTFFVLIGHTRSADPVRIEYFYVGVSDSCPTCPRDLDEKRVTEEVVRPLQTEYSDQITVEEINIVTSQGLERWNVYKSAYGLTLPRPTVVVSPTAAVNSTLVKQDFPQDPITKDWLAATIDQYLGKVDTNPFKPVVGSFQRLLSSPGFVAFSMGFINGFSPCLMAMLAFILTYSAGTSKGLKSGISRTMIFGLGLVTAIMIVGISILLLQVPLHPVLIYLHSLTWISAIIMVIIGLNLMGLLNLPISTKPFIQRLTGKFGHSQTGLFFFGIIFFFVKAPCAFPLFILLLANIMVEASLASVGYFLAFSLGLLIPFIAVGIIGGGTPELAKAIREKHRLKIRALSGFILIVYAVLLVLSVAGYPVFGDSTSSLIISWFPATLLLVAAIILGYLVLVRLARRRKQSLPPATVA